MVLSGRQGASCQMSWRRGLFHMWALFPVIWAGFFGYAGGLILFQESRPDTTHFLALTNIGIGIAFPALLLGLGYLLRHAFGWIAKGVR
jgi:hypothetical protein